MSQENVEIVRRAFEFEVFGRGGWSEARAIFDPDMVMRPLEERPIQGVESIRDNFERWRSAWDEFEVTVEELVDMGDRVVLACRHRGEGRGSGIAIDAVFYEVYTLRERKIVRVEEFGERAEALEAAGLSG